MFEKLVAWVLNTYIGEYVEDFNTDKLSIGIMQGHVELGYLPLKKDALRNLDMPIEVRSGFIGRVCLVIPWKQLNSSPWVITLEDLYLVAGPLHHTNYDEASEKKNLSDRKKAQLEALEDKWQMQKQISPQSSGGWGLWGYGSSLASMGYNIIENIQLEIKNVHIRYEDDVTVPGCPFACGITIDMLSAQSTDATWLPKFVSRNNTDIMHKLADLKEFAVYWDINTRLVGNLQGKELQDVLNSLSHRAKNPEQAKSSPEQTKGSSEQSESEPDHQYILEPVTAGAKMKRNLSAMPLRSANNPRIQLDIQMERMAFGVSEEQYQGMASWMQDYNRFDKGRKYRRWHPNVAVIGHAKEWWKFAITSTVHFIKEDNHRRTKDYMLGRARDVVRYCEAYNDKLTNGAYYMDTWLKSDLERIEDEWGFEELKVLRNIVMNSLDEQGRAAMLAKGTEPPVTTPTPPEAIKILSAPSSPQNSPTDQAGMLQRWFPGWGGWYGAPAAQSPAMPGEATKEVSGKNDSKKKKVPTATLR